MLKTIYYVKMESTPDGQATEGQEATPYVKDIKKYVVVKDPNIVKQLCGDFLEARVDDKGSH